MASISPIRMSDNSSDRRLFVTLIVWCMALLHSSRAYILITCKLIGYTAHSYMWLKLLFENYINNPFYWETFRMLHVLSCASAVRCDTAVVVNSEHQCTQWTTRMGNQSIVLGNVWSVANCFSAFEQQFSRPMHKPKMGKRRAHTKIALPKSASIK